MTGEHVVKLIVGCHPEAAVSGGLLLQSEDTAFLLFNAMSDETNADGRYEPVGTAVVQFKSLNLTRFGGPNDEAMPEHPLYHKGLAKVGYAICEVIESSWAVEVMATAKRSAERIWGNSFPKVYRDHRWATRHFLFSFHDSTFECLAEDFTLSLHQEPHSELLYQLTQRLMDFMK